MNCAMKGCTKPGRWQPTFLLWAFHGHQPAPAHLLGMALCNDHKEKAVVADFLTDDGWDKIVAGFRMMGKMSPDRELTKLDWTELS